jgi:hypothetical protein
MALPTVDRISGTHVSQSKKQVREVTAWHPTVRPPMRSEEGEMIAGHGVSITPDLGFYIAEIEPVKSFLAKGLRH